MYAQVKANVDKLDKKGKQRLLQLLQKSLAAPATKPAAAPAAAAPAAAAAGPGSATVPAGPAGAPRTEPNLNAPADGGKKKSAPKKAAAPSQAEIDADRARLMGPDNGGANESRVIKFKSRFL
jgi:hypothetical protein